MLSSSRFNSRESVLGSNLRNLSSPSPSNKAIDNLKRGSWIKEKEVQVTDFSGTHAGTTLVLSVRSYSIDEVTKSFIEWNITNIPSSLLKCPLSSYFSEYSNNLKQRNAASIRIRNNKKSTAPGRCSQAVSHPSANRARRCLTAVFGWEPVFSTWYGLWQKDIGNFAGVEENEEDRTKTDLQVAWFPAWWTSGNPWASWRLPGRCDRPGPSGWRSTGISYLEWNTGEWGSRTQ